MVRLRVILPFHAYRIFLVHPAELQNKNNKKKNFTTFPYATAIYFYGQWFFVVGDGICWLQMGAEWGGDMRCNGQFDIYFSKTRTDDIPSFMAWPSWAIQMRGTEWHKVHSNNWTHKRPKLHIFIHIMDYRFSLASDPSSGDRRFGPVAIGGLVLWQIYIDLDKLALWIMAT